jgi:nucleotide-binding universal stress UspA family protein
MGTTRIVVGVDGSDGSKAALEWALREGSARGATVEAVMCWSVGGLSRVGRLGGRAAGQDAMAVLDRLLHEFDALRAEMSIDVKPIVVEGHPVRVLPEAAVGAKLLVVGSRGYGAFVGSVLGSVSLAVASRAPCAVAVVPDPAQSRQRSMKLAVHRHDDDAGVSSEASRWRAVRGGSARQSRLPSSRDSA